MKMYYLHVEEKYKRQTMITFEVRNKWKKRL